MSLVATCPSCGTVFSMVREQLEASSGQVRCGHCMVVFDATLPLAPKPDPEQTIASSIERSPIATAVEMPQEDLSFVQQARRQAFWSQKSVMISLLVGSFLLSLLLGIQLLRTESERITQSIPALKLIAHALCGISTCASTKRLKIDGWRIESSNFQKEGADAFRLTLQLKNTHSASLLIPQLELSLLDATDSLLIRKTMPVAAPDESMGNGDERSYHFLITSEPNLTAKIIGYRLILFYP
jgi:predicted Zn finger-like uncharacterized protein